MQLSRDQIVTFWGGIFSNWYLRDMVVDGQVYNCSEQWMMVAKARLFGDEATAQRILAERNPREQKALGREVKGFIEPVWAAARKPLVYRGLMPKFTQHRDLYDGLLATDNKLIIEASPVDRIWGVGLAADNPKILDTDTWQGLNELGTTLMWVRSDLLAARACQPSAAPQGALFSA